MSCMSSFRCASPSISCSCHGCIADDNGSEMIPLSFFYYSLVGSISIIFNSFIIFSSAKLVRGEFKWVFLGSAATNVLLSLSQLLLMPGAQHWPFSHLTLVVSSNPLLADHPLLCSWIYEIFYFRQLEASVLCICLVPLNRAFAICWRSVTPTNPKVWAIIAIIPNIIPFLVLMFVKQFPGTSYDDMEQFPPDALRQLEKDDTIVCTLTSHFSKVRDVLQTTFFLLCPLISYPVAIICVIKLLIFVWLSQRNVRATVSQQVLQRQKGILITICIQAIAPLLFFSPLFISMLFVDRDDLHPNQWSPDHSAHLLTAVCPMVDAIATVLCLKPYRKALRSCFPFSKQVANEDRRPSDAYERRPPSKGEDAMEIYFPPNAEIIESRV